MFSAWKDLRHLPRPLWTLFGAILVNRMGTMALPFLALYLTKGVGLSVATAGWVLASYGGASIVASPLAGRLSDRFGPVVLMESSLFSSAVIMLLFPLAKSLSAIVVMTILLSLTNEAFRPASMSVISGLTTAKNRKSAFALIRFAINLGMSFGPALGGFLAQKSYPSIFIVDGLTTLAAGFVLVLTRFRREISKSSSEAGELHSFGAPLRNRTFLFFLLAIVPAGIVFFQHISTMPVFLVRDLRYQEATFGALMAINTVLIIILEIPITAAISQWNYRLSLSLGSLLYAVGFGAMAFARELWSIIATIVIWTFGEMILFPALTAYVAEVAPTSRRGEYMGIYTMMFSISFALGPWLGMQIFDRFGATILWTSIFFLGLVSPIMLTRIAVPLKKEKD